MAVPTTRSLDMDHGRYQTPLGEVLVCVQCAFGRDPPQFTYLHGYYVRGGRRDVHNILRNVGGRLTDRTGNVLCTFCHSCQDHSWHEGFFRLWRSVELPPSQHANALAAADKRGWVVASVQELWAAAEALRDAPRVPTMMGRDGPDGTVSSVLLGPLPSQMPVLAAVQPGAAVVPSWGVPPRPKAPPPTAHAPQAAAQSPHVAYATVSAGSAGPPVDQTRLANLEAEVQRQAEALTSLQLAVSELARRVGP